MECVVGHASMDQCSEYGVSAAKRQLLRFLILGSEKGVYHSKEQELSVSSVACVEELIAEGQASIVVDKVKKVVREGRCIRMNAPLLALATVCRAMGDQHKAVRESAYRAVGDVCTTPTHIFTFLQCLKKLSPGGVEQDQVDGGQKADGKVRGQKADGKVRGQKADGKVEGQKADGKVEGQQTEEPGKKKVNWNRSTKTLVKEWYKKHEPKRLAMLVTKYRKREGWTHQQLLKNAHLNPRKNKALDVILCYVTSKPQGKGLSDAKEKEHDAVSTEVLNYLTAVETARTMAITKDTSEKDDEVVDIVNLIRDHKLLREHVPPGFLQFKSVWRALVERMPMIALLRNLGRITRTEMLEDSASLDLVLQKLQEIPTWHRCHSPSKAQDDEGNCFYIHPYALLTAWFNYKRGRSRKGKVSWKAHPKICECLEKMFYQSFENAPQTNLRIMVAMDVTESMGTNNVSSSDGAASKSLTARVASAAMCLVTLKVEQHVDVFALSSAELHTLDLGADCPLNTALDKIKDIRCGHKDEILDCTMPVKWASDHAKEYDAFIIYTDNIHSFQTSPAQALKEYRERLGLARARLAVVGMSSTGFSMADPQDHGMMDVVGFDIKTPDILHDFISGRLDDCNPRD